MVVEARPEKVRPNIPYYDDAFEIRSGVPDLVGEKNYEEVYRNYEFFEVHYDSQGRVIHFIAYKRGDVAWRARIAYGSKGEPVKVLVTDGEGNAIPLPEP